MFGFEERLRRVRCRPLADLFVRRRLFSFFAIKYKSFFLGLNCFLRKVLNFFYFLPNGLFKFRYKKPTAIKSHKKTIRRANG